MQEGISLLIFAKAKVPYPKEKCYLHSNYCLFLEFKCLTTLLCTFSHVIFGEIIVAMDAQILFWLLSYN